MTWETLLALSSVAITGMLGYATYRRGSKADSALNIATNVKTTFDASQHLVETLQDEVERHRQSLNDCEKASAATRAEAAALALVADAQARKIHALEAQVADHEQTIARHEQTITGLQARE